MLYANGSEEKIGTGPYEIENDRQVFYYATYRPDKNQINVSGYFCFGDAVIGDYDPKHLLNKDPESYFNARRSGENTKGLGFCKSGGNFHSEFDSFNIGETDNNDFFEVVKTDGEYQPKEDGAYTTPGDPYQYRVVNGQWETKSWKNKGKIIKNWVSLENNQTATGILDKRHPGVRVPSKPNDTQLPPAESEFEDIDGDEASSIIDN
jgi:hypothetical protein